ncbi:unnamed protein product, partial [marine sediment metagenome]
SLSSILKISILLPVALILPPYYPFLFQNKNLCHKVFALNPEQLPAEFIMGFP